MERNWWKEAVVYQVYPRSFLDANGDGIGDLRGIIRKLDYIKELGVDVIWLNPVYQSPNDDNGYDISNYYQIMDDFGTMADFDELLAEAHRRGLRLVMDLVVNHTSDEHPWFRESRSSRDNPKRDYYIWRPARNGREPNNWRSFFTQSAWEWDETTGEYYLHLFSKKQPDLNWENPEVRREIYRMMRWWLDKGIDGFRMDVINFLAKPAGLPDAPPADQPSVFGGPLYANQPGIHPYLQEMHREVLSRYDIMTVGETGFVAPEHGVLYTGADRRELNMVFHFEIVDTPAQLDLPLLKAIWGKWYHGLKEGKGWNSIYLNNHDQPRQVSRFGNDRQYRVESAKLLATLTLTLPGTPYIYQGEELGMTNVCFETIDDYRDIEMLNRYAEQVAAGRDPQTVLAGLRPKCRDNSRTPLQWDDSPQAGFTSGEPWIKVNPNYPAINAAAAEADPGSVLHYYRKLLRLRKQTPALVYGDYRCLDEADPFIYSYLRTLDGERFWVLLNFSDQPQTVALPDELRHSRRELLLANYPEAENCGAVLPLRPWEARLYRMAMESGSAERA
ncbi:oligo-1,6-glucosidase [Hydrogenispora ethanolica]|uniref:Oligo-1,6-glucosidase n=1 Tax=Hydrogenispora ethanolica TaxID=1082276 RepID=A0A4R1RQH3_HYDET|nr:alpha-glucosidase [Hydrogenispora ethanolica]TCL68479.1 oligo-1,6-glucosidase [Hydrogenispora ethanolica]